MSSRHQKEEMARVVDRFVYAGYGELSSVCRDRNSTANPNARTLACHGPDEALVYSRGNAYLESEFPKLTIIRDAVIDESRNQLSAGMSAAVVVIAVAVGTLLLTGLSFLWRRRRGSARVPPPLGDAAGFVKL